MNLPENAYRVTAVLLEMIKDCDPMPASGALTLKVAHGEYLPGAILWLSPGLLGGWDLTTDARCGVLVHADVVNELKSAALAPDGAYSVFLDGVEHVRALCSVPVGDGKGAAVPRTIATDNISPPAIPASDLAYIWPKNAHAVTDVLLQIIRENYIALEPGALYSTATGHSWLMVDPTTDAWTLTSDRKRGVRVHSVTVEALRKAAPGPDGTFYLVGPHSMVLCLENGYAVERSLLAVVAGEESRKATEPTVHTPDPIRMTALREAATGLFAALAECNASLETVRTKATHVVGECKQLGKQFIRPSIHLIKVTTAFYRAGAAMFDFLGDRLDLLGESVSVAAGQMEALVDRTGAPTIAELEAIDAEINQPPPAPVAPHDVN
jgi:hypothetical protein